MWWLPERDTSKEKFVPIGKSDDSQRFRNFLEQFLNVQDFFFYKIFFFILVFETENVFEYYFRSWQH